jgi:hypothetical protein
MDDTTFTKIVGSFIGMAGDAPATPEGLKEFLHQLESDSAYRTLIGQTGCWVGLIDHKTLTYLYIGPDVKTVMGYPVSSYLTDLTRRHAKRK